jgi:hypothetical protein
MNLLWTTHRGNSELESQPKEEEKQERRENRKQKEIPRVIMSRSPE